jgi:hypothetical protein
VVPTLRSRNAIRGATALCRRNHTNRELIVTHNAGKT